MLKCFTVMTVIAISNQKGGVGKTTTTLNLGRALSYIRNKVLLIDLDFQGGLTLSCGINPDSLEKTIYNALVGNEPIENLIHNLEHFDLIPANIDLAGAEVELLNEIGRERILDETIKPLKDKYDFIIIDTPPSLGILTVNALCSADGVIIPVECKYLGLRGLSILLKTIEKLRKRIKPSLQIVGILPTMYERTSHSNEVVGELKEYFKGKIKIFNPVKKTVKFPESVVVGKSIIDYAPTSDVAKEYLNIAKEVELWAESRQ